MWQPLVMVPIGVLEISRPQLLYKEHFCVSSERFTILFYNSQAIRYHDINNDKMLECNWKRIQSVAEEIQ